MQPQAVGDDEESETDARRHPMSQKTLSLVEWKELQKWLFPPQPDPPFPVDPLPEWMIDVIDDPLILRKYAEDSVNLRMKTLEIELQRMKTIENLIAVLPLPLS
jgi:hypothetical protein